MPWGVMEIWFWAVRRRADFAFTRAFFFFGRGRASVVPAVVMDDRLFFMMGKFLVFRKKQTITARVWPLEWNTHARITTAGTALARQMKSESTAALATTPKATRGPAIAIPARPGHRMDSHDGGRSSEIDRRNSHVSSKNTAMVQAMLTASRAWRFPGL